MIIGHRRNQKYLESVLKKGRIAHAYLFTGPDGVGKRTIAREYAKSLLCEKDGSTLGGCNQCARCIQVNASTHPDFIRLSSEEKLVAEETRGIGIKNVHALRRHLSQSAWHGGRKVVIIDGGEQLSFEAQTALLKTLEDAPPHAVFLILSSFPARILSTIRSRSVPMDFSFVSDEEMTPLVSTLSLEKQEVALAFARGRPGVLLKVLEDPEALARYEARDETFLELFTADLGEQFTFGEKASREEETMRDFFDFCASHARQALSKAIESKDKEAVRRLAKFSEILLERYRLLLTTAVNRRLLLESVFFSLHGLAPEKHE